MPAWADAAVPPSIDDAALRAYLAVRPGVTELHDLHVWPTSTTGTASTAHPVMPARPPGYAFMATLAAEPKAGFAIGHVTLQVETGADTCELARTHPA